MGDFEVDPTRPDGNVDELEDELNFERGDTNESDEEGEGEGEGDGEGENDMESSSLLRQQLLESDPFLNGMMTFHSLFIDDDDDDPTRSMLESSTLPTNPHTEPSYSHSFSGPSSLSSATKSTIDPSTSFPSTPSFTSTSLEKNGTHLPPTTSSSSPVFKWLNPFIYIDLLRYPEVYTEYQQGVSKPKFSGA
ncbi:hypothetical protein HMI54_012205 [Coelomomyces lativittatus]|nr:hypothetical protein HMI54_012205 [Coelomomyces lativittatus]